MKANFDIRKFENIQTPFYYYDTELLRQTLREVNNESQKYQNYCVHYAVKANANPKITNATSKNSSATSKATAKSF